MHEQSLEADIQRQAQRVRLLEVRGQLTDRAEREAALQARLLAWLNAAAVRTLGFYWPIRGEPDITSTVLAWRAADDGRAVALPVIVGELLRFRTWDGITPLDRGAHGIPVPQAGAWLEPQALLVPCLGFDAQRYRLGYGGGYYDRTLALIAHHARPRTCGVAFEIAKLESIDAQAHDIALDVVVTEQALYR